MKILIVDDHPLFLAGLRSLFKMEKEMEICGEAKNGQEAISQAKQLKPDVIIMDINMPGVNKFLFSGLLNVRVHTAPFSSTMSSFNSVNCGLQAALVALTN